MTPKKSSGEKRSVRKVVMLHCSAEPRFALCSALPCPALPCHVQDTQLPALPHHAVLGTALSCRMLLRPFAYHSAGLPPGIHVVLAVLATCCAADTPYTPAQ